MGDLELFSRKIQENVRRPAVAGVFYPSDAEQLRVSVENFLSRAVFSKKVLEQAVFLKAIVVPHAGYPYSGLTAGFGYALLRELVKKKPVEKVVCVGPSHYALFSGVAEPACTEWLTPLGVVKSFSLREYLRGEKVFSRFLIASPEAHAQEHCLEVQLPFLQIVLKKFEFAGLLTGEISSSELGNALAFVAKEKNLFLIASSDLSHYHSYEQARALDAVVNESVPSLDLRAAQGVEACGKTGVLALMHCAKKLGWHGEFLDYRNSGDTSGDKTAVVGYGCYAFFE